MTRSVARSLCDSWATCSLLHLTCISRARVKGIVDRQGVSDLGYGLRYIIVKQCFVRNVFMNVYVDGRVNWLLTTRPTDESTPMLTVVAWLYVVVSAAWRRWRRVSTNRVHSTRDGRGGPTISMSLGISNDAGDFVTSVIWLDALQRASNWTDLRSLFTDFTQS